MRRRRDEVVASGLRVWMLAVSLLVAARGAIALLRPPADHVLPYGWEAGLSVAVIGGAMAMSQRPRDRSVSVRGVIFETGALTTAAALTLSLGALHAGYGTAVMHAWVVLVMTGMSMLVPLPIVAGAVVLGLTALTYPVVLLVGGVASLNDPLFAAQVVDLAAGWSMATLALVMHNQLFAGRWKALSALARLAEHDGLTGVLNRRTFTRRLGAELSRNERYGTPFGLVMLDIDGFKRFNSDHGYAVGDATLRAVAATLERVAAGSDATIARFGGEEFVALLPGASKKDVSDFADACRASVAALRVRHETQSLSVTVSAGYAHCGEDAEPRLVLGAADAALYKAKSGGGNRTESAAWDTIDATHSAPLITRAERRRSMRADAELAYGDDTRSLHEIALRWTFGMTAAWVCLIGVMDIAFHIDGRFPGDLRWAVAGRTTMTVALVAAIKLVGPRFVPNQLTLMHAGFMMTVTAGIIGMMQATGGLTSPYFTQLVYLISSWALAFSVRPAVSAPIILTTAVLAPLYFVATSDALPSTYPVAARLAVLGGAAFFALTTQRVFGALRRGEVSARARLADLARLDPLTGLPNRAAFEGRVASAMRRAGPDAPLGLIIVDLDHFKRLNDTHGHAAGDQALVALADAFEDAMRAADRCARLGGEEFAAVLPMTDIDGARVVAERVRANIAGLGDRAPAPITASVGATQWRPGDTVSAMLARADEALRAAKNNGRDRVEVA